MTCENNIIGSKKKIAKGMLLFVGVGMMMSGDTVYGTTPLPSPTEQQLTDDKIKKVLCVKIKDICKTLKENNKLDVKNNSGCMCCCKDDWALEFKEKGDSGSFVKICPAVRSITCVGSNKIRRRGTSLADNTLVAFDKAVLDNKVKLDEAFDDVSIT